MSLALPLAVLLALPAAAELGKSPDRAAAAWAELGPDEGPRMRALIDSAPERARAEEDFVELGWRLAHLRLDRVDDPQRRQQLLWNIDRLCDALPPDWRAVLGPALQRSGYAATEPVPLPQAAAAAAPGPARRSNWLSYAHLRPTRRAQEALRRGEHAAAEAAAREAIALAPQEMGAYPLKALALSMQGRHDEALLEIRAALRMSPKTAGLRSVYAFILNRCGQYRQAARSGDASLEGRPTSAWAWYQLSWALAGVGERAESLRSLEQAATLAPRDYAGRLERARRAAGTPALLALYAADPCPEGSWSVRRPVLGVPWAKFVSWGALLGTLLAALTLSRQHLADWLVGVGMAGGGTPRPTTLAAPITGLPVATGADGAPRIPAGYRIIRQIGSGGMGAVYEAEDVSLARRVAIKRMRDEIRRDPRELARFLTEARTVAALRHANIVEIHAIVEGEGEVFLVFEYLDGKTLDAVVGDNGRLSVPEARAVLRQVCAALTYAHARGVIHRDLKPSNIMFTRDHRVKVMDFGVARQAHDALSRLSLPATVAGTPPYMAPESETGVVRPESDLYSLAVCLYEMLTGARPFDGSNAGVLMSKMQMRFEPVTRRVAGLPAGLDAFFASTLHSDPERRPRTAAAFLVEFEAAAGGA